MLNEDIGPVEQVFLTMVKVLEQADQDAIMAGLHETGNRLTVAHLRCLDEIDVFKVDPYRFGSLALIDRLNAILTEATR